MKSAGASKRWCGRAAMLSAWAVLFAQVACDDAVSTYSGPATPAGANASAEASDAAPEEKAPELDFQESEFQESERSRDPFRDFRDLLVADARASLRTQRNVVLDEYSLDELRLIGIVTRIQPAKAMLVDPKGRGHVVERGQFVGRPDVLRAAGPGGRTFEVNWRVDSIRPADVVFVREDPTNPDVPSSTRVIALRPEGDEPEAQ